MPGDGRTSLSVISCDDCCGACCTYKGTGVRSPPGYDLLHGKSESDLIPWVRDSLNWALWGSMPAKLRDGLDAYYERVGLLAPGTGEACCWLDPATGRCSHYEWRPEACRNFVVGGKDCLQCRRKCGVDNEP